MPCSIYEKNTVFQSTLSFLGITDLTNETVRLGRKPVAWQPLVLCVPWRDWGCWCVLWGEIHSLTGNICFNLLQHQHDRCGRKPVVTVWVPFLQPELGLRSGLFGQAAQHGPICQNMDITGSIIWEYPGALSLFRGNYCPSKPGWLSLHFSLSLFLYVFSLGTFPFWASITSDHFPTLTPPPLPLPRESGFLWRMTLPKGIKISMKQVCKDADAHTLTLTKP